MKKFGAAILAVVILAAIGVPLFLKGREVKAGAENFIPAEAFLYVSQRGIGNDWERLKGSNFWREITSSEGWKDIEPQLRELQRKLELKLGFALDAGSVKELFGREAALALLPGGEEGLQPRGLLLTRVGMKTRVQERLVSMQDKLSGQGKLSSETYKEVEITNLKAFSTGLELSYAFLGDWLALGIGNNSGSTLKKVIDIHGGEGRRSLAGNENFQDIRARLPQERAGLFYLNVEESLAVYPGETIEQKISRGKIPLKKLSRRMSTSLEMFKSAGGATWFGKGLKAKFCLLLNGEKTDKDLMGLFSGEPRKPESIKYVPQGTMVYASSSSLNDIGAYWEYLQETLKERDPAAAERMFRKVERLETEGDISLKDDIFPWMGNEFACALSEINLRGMFPLPGYFLMLKVRDEEKAREALNKVESILEGINLKKGVPTPLKLEGKNYEGVEMKVLQVPFLSPAYAFVNDFLIISTRTSTMKKLIDIGKDKGNSLSKDANFKRLESIFGEKSNGLYYLNVEKTLDTVRSLTGWVLSVRGRGLSRMKSRKATLESREFETPEDRERELRAFQGKLEMMKKRESELRRNLEKRLYPLLESLKVVKSLGVSILIDKKSSEQTFYLAVEER